MGGTDPENPSGQPVCRAFPDGIPSEILNGGFDHREPLGKEAVLFRLSPDKTEADLKAWEDASLDLKKRDMSVAISDFQQPAP